MILLKRTLRWLRDVAQIPNTLNRLERKIDDMNAAQKAEIKAAVAEEREQFLTRVEEIVAERLKDAGTSPEDVQEIITDIRGIVPDSGPPTDGTHNVSMSATSNGKEYMKIALLNNGVTPERAALLNGVFDAAKLAGTSQAPGGASFTSEFSFVDNGTADSFSLDNANQKNAFDVALLTAFLAEAQAALDAGNTPTP